MITTITETETVLLNCKVACSLDGTWAGIFETDETTESHALWLAGHYAKTHKLVWICKMDPNHPGEWYMSQRIAPPEPASFNPAGALIIP